MIPSVTVLVESFEYPATENSIIVNSGVFTMKTCDTIMSSPELLDDSIKDTFCGSHADTPFPAVHLLRLRYPMKATMSSTRKVHLTSYKKYYHLRCVLVEHPHPGVKHSPHKRTRSTMHKPNCFTSYHGNTFANNGHGTKYRHDEIHFPGITIPEGYIPFRLKDHDVHSHESHGLR